MTEKHKQATLRARAEELVKDWPPLDDATLDRVAALLTCGMRDKPARIR